MRSVLIYPSRIFTLNFQHKTPQTHKNWQNNRTFSNQIQNPTNWPSQKSKNITETLKKTDHHVAACKRSVGRGVSISITRMARGSRVRARCQITHSASVCLYHVSCHDNDVCVCVCRQRKLKVTSWPPEASWPENDSPMSDGRLLTFLIVFEMIFYDSVLNVLQLDMLMFISWVFENWCGKSCLYGEKFFRYHENKNGSDRDRFIYSIDVIILFVEYVERIALFIIRTCHSHVTLTNTKSN